MASNCFNPIHSLPAAPRGKCGPCLSLKTGARDSHFGLGDSNEGALA